MIVNVHRKNTKNVGDIQSAPAKYFVFSSEIVELDLIGYSGEKSATKAADWNCIIESADLIIVGGGGLLGIDFFSQGLRQIFELKKSTCKVVLWGAGHNEWRIKDWRELKYRLSFDDLPFDLIGVRDDNQGFEWVPCVSCLDVRFEKYRNANPKREFGLFVHENTLKTEDLRKRLPRGIDVLDNDADLETVLEFLSSSETVLTDSYHGAYWATLLNRKVVAFPSSSKFYDLRHAIPLCSTEDWRRSLKLAITYPEALTECREANKKFADKVGLLSELVVKPL